MVSITAASSAPAGLEAEKLATANAAFTTRCRIVQTLGVAVVVAILGDRSADSLERFRVVWLVCAMGLRRRLSSRSGTRLGR